MHTTRISTTGEIDDSPNLRFHHRTQRRNRATAYQDEHTTVGNVTGQIADHPRTAVIDEGFQADNGPWMAASPGHVPRRMLIRVSVGHVFYIDQRRHLISLENPL